MGCEWVIWSFMTLSVKRGVKFTRKFPLLIRQYWLWRDDEKKPTYHSHFDEFSDVAKCIIKWNEIKKSEQWIYDDNDGKRQSSDSQSDCGMLLHFYSYHSQLWRAECCGCVSPRTSGWEEMMMMSLINILWWKCSKIHTNTHAHNFTIHRNDKVICCAINKSKQQQWTRDIY
jgi:hypothetical protein